MALSSPPVNDLLPVAGEITTTAAVIDPYLADLTANYGLSPQRYYGYERKDVAVSSGIPSFDTNTTDTTAPTGPEEDPAAQEWPAAFAIDNNGPSMLSVQLGAWSYEELETMTPVSEKLLDDNLMMDLGLGGDGEVGDPDYAVRFGDRLEWW